MGIFNRKKGIINGDAIAVKEGMQVFGATHTKDTGVLENIYDTIAKDISILEFQHMDSNEVLGMDDDLNYILRKRPNKLQTPSGFLYTLVYNMIRYGNGLALPKYEDEYTTSTVTIGMSEYELRAFKGKKLQSLDNIDVSNIKFGFGYREEDGEIYMVWQNRPKINLNINLDITPEVDTYIYPYKDLIHLRYKEWKVFQGDYYNEYFSNVERLIDDNVSGMLNQIQHSGSITGILNLKAGMVADDKKAARIKTFVQQLQNKSGLLITDANENFQELKRSFNTVNTADIDFNINQLYRLYGVNKTIIEGTYTNSEYQAYYSKTLEPIINRLQQELEYKLLTKEQLQAGEHIVVTRNFFVGANIKELGMVVDKLIYHGITSPNEIRLKLGFQPIPEGDVYYTNANAIEVAAAQALKVSEASQDGTDTTLEGGDNNE